MGGPLKKLSFKTLKEEWRDRRALRRARGLMRRHPERPSRPKTFCFFVGYPRSGHSLVGSLIDAHPNAALAHEQDALKYVRKGVDRKELFALLLDNSRRIGKKGRRQTGYSYIVPGQFQGLEKDLQLIGDKRGGNSSRWLRDEPGLLDQLRGLLREELRILHVSRNPFDNIATMAYRHAKGKPERMTEKVLRQEKENYMSLARTVEWVRQRCEAEEILHLSLEKLLQDPDPQLRRTFGFLGLELREDHLEACKGLLYSSPSRSRDRFHWPEELIQEILQEIRSLPYLYDHGTDTP